MTILCLLLTAGYITTVLEDAMVYCKHAGKKELDADDVQLAIQSRLDHSYTNPPPREVYFEMPGSFCFLFFYLCV